MTKTKFDLIYINLDRAEARRAMIEQSIARARFSDRWSFYRFSAVSAASDQVKNAPGKLSGPYKGNYLSHLQILKHAGVEDSHLLVVEDDVEFSDQTGRILEELADTLPEDSWDVIRTEITLMSAVDFPKIYKLSANDTAKKSVKLMPLADFNVPITGSSAYLVNRRSKRRFGMMVESLTRDRNGMLDIPFDAYLCDIVQYKALKGFVTIPFLTAPSVHADESQAPQVNAEGPRSPTEAMDLFNKTFLQLLTAFRRLCWIGYSPDQVWPVNSQLTDDLFAISERDRMYQQMATWLLIMQGNVPYKSDYQLEPIEIQRVARSLVE